MDYHGHDTNAFFTANFIPRERLRIYAEFAFNQVDEGLDGISINLAQVPGVPPGNLFDYSIDETLGDYSHVNVRHIMGKYGFSYEFANCISLLSYLKHDNYNDNTPYLFDATGTVISLVAGLGYRF